MLTECDVKFYPVLIRFSLYSSGDTVTVGDQWNLGAMSHGQRQSHDYKSNFKEFVGRSAL